MNKYLVITSISKPNNALKIFSEQCKQNNTKFVLIGDNKSPKDFELANCDYWDIDRQLNSDIKFSEIVPQNSYSRKNIGYILAIRNNADIIIETDDDNLPLENFWLNFDIKTNAKRIVNKDWINIYKYFTDKHIWPRGFPLEKIHDKLPNIKNQNIEKLEAPIQQGLADDNPDIDAIYRLVFDVSIKFDKSENIALAKNTYCPFNSQNTKWFPQAFPLMYLPSYCSFRMTDIWRSFVAQRIAWEYDWNILFHQSTVYQKRNEHNLIKDFEDEISGYLSNIKIVNTLKKLKLSKNINDNMLICYKALVDEGYIGDKEIELLNCWIKEMNIRGTRINKMQIY